MILKKNKKYLQIALNSTPEEAEKIIPQLPVSEQILVEAGTPLIKIYGQKAISTIRNLVLTHFFPEQIRTKQKPKSLIEAVRQLQELARMAKEMKGLKPALIKTISKSGPVPLPFEPYIVADLKCDDLARKEVPIAQEGGASAATCLGVAPSATIDSFIEECEKAGIDSMIDMMNVRDAVSVLNNLKKPPDVVVLHRGVDETEFNKEKQIPYYQIQQIKGNYDVLVAVAGGDTIQEVERAFFNDADIVVVWKSFYKSTADTAQLAKEFYQRLELR